MAGFDDLWIHTLADNVRSVTFAADTPQDLGRPAEKPADEPPVERPLSPLSPSSVNEGGSRRRLASLDSDSSTPSPTRRSFRRQRSNSDDHAPFGANGWITVLGESIPLVNNGIQLLHELSGNQRALERARQKDPIGPNGYITQAIEYVPVVNSVVQQVHEAGGEDQALERAKVRDPIGTDGYLTKVFEHIPIVSDGVMAIHNYHGEGAAAERARGYTLQKLLSKDGAITRVAELLPVSNLLAAAAHEMNGDRDRAQRALDLFQNWADASQPDGPLFQVAELLPGVDAVAFAVHLQGGHYAQALRSVTKTSWVNVDIDEVVLLLRFRSLSNLWASKVDVARVDVIPRQLSLVVGLSDLLTNFLQTDQQGRRRSSSMAIDGGSLTRGQTVMDLSKELIKGIVDDKLSRRVDYFTEMMPDYMDWLVEIMNRYLPEYRRESLSWRLFSPRRLPPLSEEALQELQNAFPNMTVASGPLTMPPEISTKSRQRTLPEGSSTVSCWAFAGCLGLGTKVGMLACTAGALMGAAEAGRAVVRRVAECVNQRNMRIWDHAILRSQPTAEGSDNNSVASSSSSAPPESNGENIHSPNSNASSGLPDSAPGFVLEITADDVERLDPLARNYFLEAVSPERGPACSLRALFRSFSHRWLLDTLRETVDTEHPQPFVVDVDLDPWEVELQSYSFNLKLPRMRFAFVFHLDLTRKGESTHIVRAYAAFSDDWLSNLLQSFRDQLLGWDLRELDPRFAGFTQPVYAAFDLDCSWASPDTLRLVGRALKTRLDLPAS